MTEVEQQIEKDVLAWFEEADTDWKVKDLAGRTLLHIVAKHNTLRTIGRFKFLLGKGFDPMEEDGERRTALDVATACGNDEVLKLFVRKVAEVEPSDEK
jgi:ankyrin repeat protein